MNTPTILDLSDAYAAAASIDEGLTVFHAVTAVLNKAGVEWHAHGAHLPMLTRVLRGEKQYPGWSCPITEHADLDVRRTLLMALAKQSGVSLVEDATAPIGWRIAE